MLSDQEQRVWDDVQRFWTHSADEPARGDSSAAFPRNGGHGGPTDSPWWAVGGVWGAIFLVLFGALVPGFAVGGATVAAWALWRFGRN